MCSMKKVLLKVLQYSQENTCARVSFQAATLLKKKTAAQGFFVNFARFLLTPCFTKPEKLSRD